VDKRIKFGYIFEQTEKAFKDGQKIIIHKGGTGSGKTYDLMLFLVVFVAMQQKGKVITVVSESKPHLDIGAIRITQKILMELDLSDTVIYNSTRAIFTFPSKSVIEFFSADRIEKALGARRFLLYGNEINSLKFEIWDELARRSEFVIGDFNPTAEFWLEKFLAYYGQHRIIKSNYLNNPFLPEEERKRIELRAKLDVNFRRTHVDVEYGSLEGLIFTDWKQVEAFPENCKWVSYGMDFGFTNDPTTLVKVGLKDGELWLDELEYRTGLLASDMVVILRKLGLGWLDEIVADNKPETIFELRQAGFNVKAAYKPAGSIVYGIDVIKQYRLNVTARSLNLIRELRNYKWKIDKAGDPVNVPVDTYNHAIDALRYAVMSRKLGKRRMVRVSGVSNF
jgi:phage terminase large subunit